MFPSHASLYAAPVQLDAYMADRVGFWTDVYGFDMTPMAQKVVEDKLAGKGRAIWFYKILKFQTESSPRCVKDLSFQTITPVKGRKK